MDHVDSTLFRFRSDHSVLISGSNSESNSDEVDATNSGYSHNCLLPPCLHSLSFTPLENIQRGMQWASACIKQASLQGSSFGLMLKQYAAIETGETEEQLLSDVGLVFPLHPLDCAANAKKNEMSMLKVVKMCSEVSAIQHCV